MDVTRKRGAAGRAGDRKGAAEGRVCPRCGAAIEWPAARMVGRRAFCGELCAITWLADEAARTAWDRTALEMTRGGRWWERLRLGAARQTARRAQKRLDRRLLAGPRAEILPWLWLPTRRGAAALLTAVLAVWGAAGGPSPESRAMAPEAIRRPAAAPAPVAPPRPPSLPAPPEAFRPPAGTPPRPAVTAPARTPAPPPRPAPRPTAADITRGSTALRQVAFTFDGGDQANVAQEILDILQTRGIRCTMFLTGQFIRAHPDLVRRMAAEGHEVGNHLDTHPHLTTYAQNRRQQTLPGATREFLLGQLRRAEEAFQAVTGRPLAPYWRAPYGEHNGELRGWAAEAGYRHISWTQGAGSAEDLDTRDWVADRSSRIYRSREEIAARILEFGRRRGDGLAGGIVLMHLGTNRKTDRPHEGLAGILKSLQGRGYQVVTISELLAGEEAASSAPPPDEAPREE